MNQFALHIPLEVLRLISEGQALLVMSPHRLPPSQYETYKLHSMLAQVYKYKWPPR